MKHYGILDINRIVLFAEGGTFTRMAFWRGNSKCAKEFVRFEIATLEGGLSDKP